MRSDRHKNVPSASQVGDSGRLTQVGDSSRIHFVTAPVAGSIAPSSAQVWMRSWMVASSVLPSGVQSTRTTSRSFGNIDRSTGVIFWLLRVAIDSRANGFGSPAFG